MTVNDCMFVFVTSCSILSFIVAIFAGNSPDFELSTFLYTKIQGE